jgi:hypothetical protein
MQAERLPLPFRNGMMRRRCSPLRGALFSMSLCIDSRYITGLFAFGQWFKVLPDSFGIDAYELTDWCCHADDVESRWQTDFTNYCMGALYQGKEPEPWMHEYSGQEGRSTNPQGCHGVSFIDADTGECVSFSLLEVKAFREKRP